MRTRLLPLLTLLLAGVLLALGFPLAAGQATTEQQRFVVDRIDDTARFAALAQYVTERDEESERRATLQSELDRYHDVYGIRAGVYYRDRRAMASAPGEGRLTRSGERYRAFSEALAGRRSHDPDQVWPWDDSRIAIASPVIRDGDVVAVVLTDSPTGQLRSRILRGWLPIVAGEAAAMLLAVAAALRLTGWVLRPVRTLDRAAHEIATGQLTSRVAASEGPPELRRLAQSFNEMADNVENVLEQQRAFVADASHQLRNPLNALLLRMELLSLELPQEEASEEPEEPEEPEEGEGPGAGEGSGGGDRRGGDRSGGPAEEIESVRAEGRRLAQVLDGLLGLALAEHDSSDPQLTDVAEVAAERAAAWRPVALRKHVELRTEGQGAATGWADPVTLSSALDAIVDNAVKFTPEAETVTVTVSSAGEWVTVEVADGGPGLDDAELERIGDRFWRSNRHQNVDGTGLGLSITRALLAAGGAQLAFARNEPHGLRVTVTVPRNAPDGE